MRFHSIHHVSFEGLGFIKDWVSEQDYQLTSTHVYRGESFPILDTFDVLVIMGGPMGVYDEDNYSWLIQEKAFIKKAIQAGKKVIGICLGSQLIADALDAKVYPNSEKEIGWFPIQWNTQIESTVFHWHGDTFDLPNGAELLASSEACLNQAFKVKNQLLGLQFHLEVKPENIKLMVENGLDELQNNRFIQTKEQILTSSAHFKSSQKLLVELLSGFIRA